MNPGLPQGRADRRCARPARQPLLRAAAGRRRSAAQTTTRRRPRRRRQAQTTTEQVTTTAPPPEPRSGRVIDIVVPADTAPTVKRFSVQRDRQVVLVVESELTDHVHLHGYDLMADVAPARRRRSGSRRRAGQVRDRARGSRPPDRRARGPSLSLLAHGIGGVKDLPVPDWLFFWGGAVVLVLSFLALGALWKRPQLERRAPGRPLPARARARPSLHGPPLRRSARSRPACSRSSS